MASAREVAIATSRPARRVELLRIQGPHLDPQSCLPEAVKLGEQVEHRLAAPPILIIALPELLRKESLGRGGIAFAGEEGIDRRLRACQDLQPHEDRLAAVLGRRPADQAAEGGGNLPGAVDLSDQHEGCGQLLLPRDRGAARDGARGRWCHPVNRAAARQDEENGERLENLFMSDHEPIAPPFPISRVPISFSIFPERSTEPSGCPVQPPPAHR